MSEYSDVMLLLPLADQEHIMLHRRQGIGVTSLEINITNPDPADEIKCLFEDSTVTLQRTRFTMQWVQWLLLKTMDGKDRAKMKTMR